MFPKHNISLSHKGHFPPLVQNKRYQPTRKCVKKHSLKLLFKLVFLLELNIVFSHDIASVFILHPHC